MDGLRRDKISMAKDLTDMIKSQLRVIYGDSADTAFHDFDVVHYKLEEQFAAVAIGYLRDGGRHHALLRGKGKGNVIEALEALWSHTQRQLTEKFTREPLFF
ncbi:hypothetical protein SVAN01_11981 [Stagonosporopsis vannaccii]|nr:hypothetical protein SVAN01_11981 [Stagonosporopsis vannaccii]